MQAMDKEKSIQNVLQLKFSCVYVVQDRVSLQSSPGYFCYSL